MSVFHFKHFSITQQNSTLKVGTDAMLLGAFIRESNPFNALDIGAGTGVISLMIAQKYPLIHVDSVEIDENSCIDLKNNIENSIFNDRITYYNIDFFEFIPSVKYDIIFSNPPFYEDGFKHLPGVNYHAKHADFFNKHTFFKKVRSLLKESGTVWIIIPVLNENSWIETATCFNLYLKKKIIISAKPNVVNRLILVFSKIKICQPEVMYFLIRDNQGFYSEEYKKLTLEFHNKIPIK